MAMSDGPDSAEDDLSMNYPEIDHEPSRVWPALPASSHLSATSTKPARTPLQLPDDGFNSSQDEAEPEDDDDREFYTLQSDVADFQRTLKQRAAGPPDDGSSASGTRARKRRRGPQKAVEPSVEIKMLLSQANGAFVDRDYAKAEALANQILLLNDETYDAHALLSGIYLEQGETRLGIIANLSAAHLRPKDRSIWRSCAHLILEHGREHRAEYLKDAIYCFSQIIRIDSKDVEARYERALLVRELGLKGRAANELYLLHEMLPRDTTIMRLFAEISIDNNDIDRAKQAYQTFFADELESAASSEETFDWSDINVFVELLGYQEAYAEGIAEIKGLSRYLLGREEESFWDFIEEDDREWDADDEPRRQAVDGFMPGRFDRASYGLGLPLELRVKLGVFRLKLGPENLAEALSHFAWLEPHDDGPGAKLYDYPDLFREVADALQAHVHHHEALKFLEPLQQIEDYPDTRFYLQMGTSYRGIALNDKAELCYKTVIENDERNVEARAQLARLYEELDMPEEAFTYANEVLALMDQAREEGGLPRRRPGARRKAAQAEAATKLGPRVHRKARLGAPSMRDVGVRDAARHEAAQMQFVKLQAVQERMRTGDDEATAEWLEAARLLISEFRSARIFYPWDKYVRFLGYSKEARKRAAMLKGNGDLSDMELMADRLHLSLEQANEVEQNAALPIPSDYRGINFDQWLDIFLQCALCLAKRGEVAETYETLDAAFDANVFYHSREYSFQIHVCWAACALLFRDDETVCSVARWFMKEYQFTTDSYRLYAALHRVCDSSISWYNSGPSQKFILRQIKAMDFALVSDEYRRRHFGERASFTARDEQGNVIVNDDMDVALLMLYGHMLYVGASFANAFNYFYRAYQLDPRNPLVNLYLGLNYLHYSLKRQSENRHYLIMQGLTFLFVYYDYRQASSAPGELQEADYNIARALHMLGLTQLAVPYYEKVLHNARDLASTQEGMVSNDFTREAAYNLRIIFFTSGNLDAAQKIANEYMVI